MHNDAARTGLRTRCTSCRIANTSSLYRCSMKCKKSTATTVAEPKPNPRRTSRQTMQLGQCSTPRPVKRLASQASAHSGVLATTNLRVLDIVARKDSVSRVVRLFFTILASLPRSVRDYPAPYRRCRPRRRAKARAAIAVSFCTETNGPPAPAHHGAISRRARASGTRSNTACSPSSARNGETSPC